MSYFYDITEELVINNTNEETTQFLQCIKNYFNWMEREENWYDLESIGKITLVVDGEEINAQSHDDLLDLRKFIKKVDRCKQLRYFGIYTYNGAASFGSLSLGFSGFEHGALFFRNIFSDELRETVTFKSIARAETSEGNLNILSFGPDGLKDTDELMSDDLTTINIAQDWYGYDFLFGIEHKTGVNTDNDKKIEEYVKTMADYTGEPFDLNDDPDEYGDGVIRYDFLSRQMDVKNGEMQEIIEKIVEIDKFVNSIGSDYFVKCFFEASRPTSIDNHFELIYISNYDTDLMIKSIKL